LLFHLYLVFISVAVLAFAVASFVELNIRSLPEKLDILEWHEEIEGNDE